MSTWTVTKWNALLAWSATAVAFVMSGGDPSSRFRRVYENVRKNTHYLSAAPSAMVFGWVWSLVVVLLVAGGVLYAIHYQTCDQGYYIAATATSLAHFASLGMWGRVFYKYGSPWGGFITLWVAFATAAATVVVFGLTAGSSCVQEKTEAWIAMGLWIVPCIWYVWALVINYQYMQIPSKVLRYYAGIESRISSKLKNRPDPRARRARR